MPKGKLIVFEGIDGTGKSTQVEKLKTELLARGIDALTYREPGGTEAGERIRDILLSREDYDQGLSPEAEFLLFAAARRELCRQVLKPRLSEGKTVLLDRFRDSSVAYQGYGKGVDLEFIHAVNDQVSEGIKPDVTVLIDLPVKAALERIGGPGDRMERIGADFFERIRNGYLEIAASSPGYLVVEGKRPVDEIFREIKDKIKDSIL